MVNFLLTVVGSFFFGYCAAYFADLDVTVVRSSIARSCRNNYSVFACVMQCAVTVTFLSIIMINYCIIFISLYAVCVYWPRVWCGGLPSRLVFPCQNTKSYRRKETKNFINCTLSVAIHYCTCICIRFVCLFVYCTFCSSSLWCDCINCVFVLFYLC